MKYSTNINHYYKISKPCSLRKTIPNDIHNLKEQIEQDSWDSGIDKIADNRTYGQDMYYLSCEYIKKSTGSSAALEGVWFICNNIYEKGYGDIARLTEVQTWEYGKSYKTLKEISKIA